MGWFSHTIHGIEHEAGHLVHKGNHYIHEGERDVKHGYRSIARTATKAEHGVSKEAGMVTHTIHKELRGDVKALEKTQDRLFSEIEDATKATTRTISRGASTAIKGVEGAEKQLWKLGKEETRNFENMAANIGKQFSTAEKNLANAGQDVLNFFNPEKWSTSTWVVIALIVGGGVFLMFKGGQAAVEYGPGVAREAGRVAETAAPLLLI